jgi:predicted alpha/beta hydrolase
MAVDRQIMEERIPLPVTPSMAAGIRRLSPRSGELKGCVMMLHGLGQNSDIFMDEAKGIGLAYFLVEQGYEVFICLYRGRDASRDTLKKEPFGFEQLLSEDLPLIWKAVEKRQRHPQRFLVGYQLGGVLWGAFLARNPEKISQVTGMIHFNPRRSLASVGRWKRLRFSFFEKGFQRLAGRLLGYLPAVFFSKGMVRESRGVFEDLLTWRKE